MRRTAAIALLVALGVATPGVGAAVPPPPPNPSDAELQAGRARSQQVAGQVGELANRLAEAESRLLDLQAQVEVKMEDANKARVDLGRAENAYDDARRAAESAAVEAGVAAQHIEQQRQRVDRFVAGSYRQGSQVGSATAFVGSRTPQDVLDRALFLDVISKSELDVQDDLERARVEKVNKDSLARAALEEAEAKRQEADEARRAAEAAERAAVTAQNTQADQARQLETDKSGVEAQLAEARSHVSGLEQQRGQYQGWLADKEREEAAAAQAATQSTGSHVPARPAAPASGRSVEVVISRALSQLGVQYAWGGGNSRGPTRGIRDGGVADSYGDYAKTGFDCSGLMIYAFAGAGISLDHYSGYQYQSGRRVPLSQMRRGDMLFWQTRGRIHHVALYLGNGKMVEAPYSGSRVRVTSVRYGGIAPYAVRML
ncbi:Cell wall-associated hydrolase, NlpC family [Saccharopolyspora antimicrobica]|uniref:Cell wall-associated NlpC family hydrolase n=1 Tax=Saccharopolyspora antimicrobica TaxID=455193 RepID=A0A1I4QS49_9PSEU|nr:NlpC/P60 family protein [Saccharopolyspora antimicrobica]RKT88330.1 cell wall-associated NlpC family hydrolase [Saccharopolyspora antimicrobica]SFM42540.1 Cell wall-associated hydrolase, NlpC family [Saccharopolyspora antimicrobica]